MIQRNASWYMLFEKRKLTAEQIAKVMTKLTGYYCATETVRDGLAHFKLEDTKGTLKDELAEEERMQDILEQVKSETR